MKDQRARGTSMIGHAMLAIAMIAAMILFWIGMMR